MGLREKARKSLEVDEDESDAPVLLKVDAAEREEEVETLVESIDGRHRELAAREKALAALQDKLDTTNRDVKEAQREIDASRTKLEAREAELAETRKALRDQADRRTTELEEDLENARKDLA